MQGHRHIPNIIFIVRVLVSQLHMASAYAFYIVQMTSGL